MTSKQYEAASKVVFSSCNEAYASYAATSLRIAKSKLGAVGAYLLGRGFSPATRQMLSIEGVTYLETGDRHRFVGGSEYPAECFDWVYGPAIFAELGVKYSLYIDADVYCAARSPRDFLRPETIAGHRNTGYEEIFGSDLPAIRAKWGEAKSPGRIQSGVIFFNNEAMRKLSLSQKMIDLSEQAIAAGVPRKGDDSLLALLTFVHPEFRFEYVPARFNRIPVRVRNWRDYLAWAGQRFFGIPNIRFFHFTNGVPKPWAENQDGSTRLSEFYAAEWKRWRLARKVEARP